MPDRDRLPTDAEIDAEIERKAAAWNNAPRLADFPTSETERLKASPDILGWVIHPLGEIYLRRDWSFFAPCHPWSADTLNAMFNSGPAAYSTAFGDRAWYQLSNAARWSSIGGIAATYYVKPRPGKGKDSLGNSLPDDLLH